MLQICVCYGSPLLASKDLLLLILLATTFLGGVRLLGAEEIEGSSVVPLQVVTTVESEPMLALLTDRRLRAGPFPLDLGDVSGLGQFKRAGF